MRLYRLAADQGHEKAQLSLGTALASGLGGLPKDFQEAAKYLQLAANQGVGAAAFLFTLAEYYKYGNGVPQDDVEAERLFRLARDSFPLKKTHP